MKKILIVLTTILCICCQIIAQDLGSGLVEEEQQMKKIKLSFWHFWSDPVRKQKIYSLIAEFEQMNPEVEVVPTELSWSTGYEEILSALEQNYPLDVIELGADMVCEVYTKGFLKDITDDVVDIKDSFVTTSLTPVLYDSKIYGLPWVVDTRLMFYNKDLLKQAGLDPNKPIETWQEFYDAVKKIHNIKPRIYGFGMNTYERHVIHKKILPFIWTNNGDVLSEDNKKCVINSKQNMETLKFYLSLKPYSLVATQNEIDTAFCEGRIGFCISGSWLFSKIKKDYPKLNFGIMLIPKPDKSLTSISILGGEYLVVNKNTEHYEQSIKFIKFMIQKSEELCSELRMFFPALKNVDYKNIPWFTPAYTEVAYQQLVNSKFVPKIPNWIQIKDVIEYEFGQIINDKKTVEQGLKDIQENVNKMLKR
jgi:multiple sugar transport system substrate-binding protein